MGNLEEFMILLGSRCPWPSTDLYSPLSPPPGARFHEAARCAGL